MRKTLRLPASPEELRQETLSQEVAGNENPSPRPSPQGGEGEKKGVTGEIQAGEEENTAASSKATKQRPQKIAEKLWHGVRVLSQHGSFEIRDLCVICNNASYVYARKFLMYLYLRGIVKRHMKGHGTDWRHVYYSLCEGAERPEPLYMAPSKYRKKIEAAGGTLPAILTEAVPPQHAPTSGADEAAPSSAAPDGNPVQQNAGKSHGNRTRLPEQPEEPAQEGAMAAQEQTEPHLSKDVQETPPAIAEALEAPDFLEAERIENIRRILDGFYEDCISKIQWLNLVIHKVRDDDKMKYLQEVYLHLDAIRIAIKLYYTKLLQASQDTDLSAVFAKDGVPEELLASMEGNAVNRANRARYGAGK
ncbi:MAG: hypothetical protein AB1611_03335 [bacterium]